MDLLPAIVGRGWRAVVAAPGGRLGQLVRATGAGFSDIEIGPFRSGRKSLADIVRFGLQTPRLARRIAQLCDALRPDLIYINGPRVLPAAALARQAAPAVFHCHSRAGDPGG